MKTCQHEEEIPFPVLRTAFLFCAFVLGCHLVYWIFLPNGFFMPLQEATAAVSAFLLNVSGIGTARSGITVILPHARWEIALECTSLSALIVFLSFLGAYPCKMRSKIIGAMAGVPLLLVANMLRLYFLGVATQFFPRTAHYLHDYVWQIGFLLLVAACWIIWIDMVVKRERSAEISA